MKIPAHVATAAYRTACLAGLVVGGLMVWSLIAGDAATTQASVVVVEQANSVVREAAVAPIGAGTGSFSGQITLTGAIPALPNKVNKGDVTVKDFAVCAAQDIPDPSLMVNPKNKGIANVFVYLMKLPAGFKAAPVAAQPRIDQKGCTFVPHCLTLQAGQTVLFLNSDPILHNTNVTSPNNPFNKGIAAGNNVGEPFTYANADRLPIFVKCDFHAWMSAYHLVQNHPFSAVTDADGKFEIKDVPAGKHNFMIWQERSGYLQGRAGYAVTIDSGKNTKVALKYGGSKFTAFQGPKPKQVLVSINQ